MSRFLRPGAKTSAAFGVAFDTDREASDTGWTISYNPRERLAISEQRRRLPIYEHRDQILYLVENHATTVLVGETGSGKSTQVRDSFPLFLCYFLYFLFSSFLYLLVDESHFSAKDHWCSSC